MRTITTDNALLVEVPEGIKHTEPCKGGILCWYYGADGDWASKFIPLPPGEYEILGLADQLTEEQARLIVGGYIDFTQKEFGLTFTPAEAMVSFLKSHNLNPSTTLVLKRK